MLESLKKNLINIPGRKLDRKFIVFESDDWGTIRMPDRNAFEAFVSRGLISKNDAFSKYDALETEEDLEKLFAVLAAYKDYKGNHPVITANTVMCNPDFEKIRQSGFTSYHFETFDNTFLKYKNREKAFTIIKQGIQEGIYFPQFHAREHVNLPLWMELLSKQHPDFLYAFDMECFSIDYKDPGNRRTNLMAAYDYYSPESFDVIKESIVEGLQIFNEIFKFQSLSTVAPCYVWDNKIEAIFKQQGVRYLQGSKFQNIPTDKSHRFKKRFHYNGQQNDQNQKYFMRNGLFEPSINPAVDWVTKCLESIEVAFNWNKPAIIGTHRLNFSGSIFPENRERNLELLSLLLDSALKKWPNVEFVSTVDLAETYN